MLPIAMMVLTKNQKNQSMTNVKLNSFFFFLKQTGFKVIATRGLQWCFTDQTLNVILVLAHNVWNLTSVTPPSGAAFTNWAAACVCRELGLDELQKHCEAVCEKLRHPDREPCYQAMAGTPFFTQTAFDMLQNHSRYTSSELFPQIELFMFIVLQMDDCFCDFF